MQAPAATPFRPRFPGDSQGFQTMEEAVIALGRRQRAQRKALDRLGAWARHRILEGEDERVVNADYLRMLRRLNYMTDPAGVRSGFAPGLALAAE